MPKLKLNLPIYAANWTKTPNLVIDKLMPELKDTELRVLLVLIRQTIGWRREGRVAVLSYRTLMRQTGRSSEAIGNALKSLKARGLIHSTRARAYRNPTNFASISDTQQ
ncbi:MAG: hypothetical protein ACYC96_09670 [Fimbriimonadaceae bacterium]